MDGYVFVNIPFYVFDNASISSIQPVKVLVPFTLLLPVRWLDLPPKPKTKNWLNSTGPAQGNGRTYYDVERSGDGPAFTKIGTVQALGRSDGTGEYQLNDNNPLSGTNYYRIRMRKMPAVNQCSVVRMVKFAGEQQQQPIDVYPTCHHISENISFPSPLDREGCNTGNFDNNGKTESTRCSFGNCPNGQDRVDKLANVSYYLKIQSPGAKQFVKTIQVLR